MTEPFYAMFDTNVLVSALMSRRADSPTVALLDYVVDGRIVLLFNEEILSEYDEVLHRSKFDFSDERIQAVVDLVKTGLLLDQLKAARRSLIPTTACSTRLPCRKTELLW